jgi:GntR family transcriptional regulator / MocR family aminotransferase
MHFQLRVLKMNLIVRDGGQIAIGDSVLVPRSMPTTLIAFPPPPAATGAQRRFMCRGCYFVYEEANGLPQQSIRPGNAARGYSGELAPPRSRPVTFKC